MDLMWFQHMCLQRVRLAERLHKGHSQSARKHGIRNKKQNINSKNKYLEKSTPTVRKVKQIAKVLTTVGICIYKARTQTY